MKKLWSYRVVITVGLASLFYLLIRQIESQDEINKELQAIKKSVKLFSLKTKNNPDENNKPPFPDKLNSSNEINKFISELLEKAGKADGNTGLEKEKSMILLESFLSICSELDLFTAELVSAKLRDEEQLDYPTLFRSKFDLNEETAKTLGKCFSDYKFNTCVYSGEVQSLRYTRLLYYNEWKAKQETEPEEPAVIKLYDAQIEELEENQINLFNSTLETVKSNLCNNDPRQKLFIERYLNKFLIDLRHQGEKEASQDCFKIIRYHY